MSIKVLTRDLGPDGLPSVTSELQAETEKQLQKVLAETARPFQLHRMRHFNWLKVLLFQGLPAGYKSQDASQPWLLFWILESFQLLGAGLDAATKQRAIDTIMKCQDPDGGFGGGPQQLPGLLATYASVSILACVGRPGPGGGWDEIDRQKMYKFLMSLKQPDGSFIVSKDAEVDIRGIYCLLVTATLLDMLTPELVAGTASFIASIQTYEGGFSSASAPYYISDDEILDEPRPTLGEAHGGYAGCAIASWVMLQPFIEEDEKKGEFLKKKVDISKFMRWLAWMQGEVADIGGFRGRPNKLVDACYSWWCGGSMAIVESLITGPEGDDADTDEVAEEEEQGSQDEWVDAEWWLYNNKALQEYILSMAQDAGAGGLRDKPGKRTDVYHSFYALAGLSTAQHRVYQSQKKLDKLLGEWKDTLGFIPSTTGETKENKHPETDEERSLRRKTIWARSRSWKEDESVKKYVGGSKNRLNAIHPVLTLLISQCDAMLDYFYGQTEKSS